jgi:uncharacterized membrane protein YkvA (DUF1232 family)
MQKVNKQGFFVWLLKNIRILPKLLKLIGRLFKDPRVKFWPKAALVAAVVYVIWPFDLIPDFVVPLIGELDDLAVLYLAVRYFFASIPPAVLKEHTEAIQTGA